MLGSGLALYSHMTKSAVAYTRLQNAEAGSDLARQITEQLDNQSVDAIIVFASPQNDDYAAMLRALSEGTGAHELVGCSSAGEFTNTVSGEGMTTAVALHAPEMHFRATLAHDLATDRKRAAEALVRNFAHDQADAYEHKAALILIDALAGYAEELVEELTNVTGGAYRFFGGGAGDDARFQHTHVFCGTEVHSSAAVALEMLSNKPLGIGSRHGWTTASDPLRVTETKETQLVSLNVAPAAEAFAEHAESTGQKFDPADPMPFFLHNIVGVKTPSGHKLRVPLGLTDDGCVVCAAEVPTGATTHIMTTGGGSAAEAAASATQDAVLQVTDQGHKPAVALFFDCVATRLRLGDQFKGELESVAAELGDAKFAGFNSYGQIVRADGQFSGFHNCTAVVCVIPE